MHNWKRWLGVAIGAIAGYATVLVLMVYVEPDMVVAWTVFGGPLAIIGTIIGMAIGWRRMDRKNKGAPNPD